MILRSTNKILFIIFSLISFDQIVAGPIHDAVKSGDSKKVEQLLSVKNVKLDQKDTLGLSPLHWAVEKRRKKMIQMLVNKGADLNVQNKDGDTPLHIATMNASEKIAKFLISKKAKINKGNNQGFTPLHYAALYGNSGMASLLLQFGAKIDAKAKKIVQKKMPIHLAAQKGDVVVMSVFIDKYPNMLNITCESNSTLLHIAVVHNQIDAVKYLIVKGAKIEAQTKEGHRPLHLAVQSNNIKIVEILLALGAQKNCVSKNKQTPLSIACINNNTEIIQLLKKNIVSITSNVLSASKSTPSATHSFTQDPQKKVITDVSEEIVVVVKGSNSDASNVENCAITSSKVKHSQNILNIMLRKAAQRGKVAQTKELLEQGADPNTKNKDQHTPLALAVKHGHADVVMLLIGSGANKDPMDRHKKTPLGLAVEAGHIKLAKLLIEMGANKEINNWKPLHWAAFFNDVVTAKSLIVAGANKEVGDDEENTPLHIATQYGGAEVVTLLLNSGADMEVRNKWKYVPLHKAVRNGNIEAVRLLIKAGANKEVQRRKITPLQLAASCGYTEIAKLLIDAGANKEALGNYKETPLHQAASNGHLGVVGQLVNIDTFRNNLFSSGTTPLHQAASEGHIGVVKFLIDAGANKNALDRIKEAPLHNAAKNGHIGVVKLLLDLGVNKDVRSSFRYKKGYTPLHYAIEKDHLEIVKLLITSGASINKKNSSGRTPLDLAFEKNNKELLNFISFKVGNKVSIPALIHDLAYAGDIERVIHLIKKGKQSKSFDINKRNQNGHTLLHCAAKNGFIDIVKLLIVIRGVNQEIRDNEFWTPLHWAAWNGHEQVVKLLLSAEANPDPQDNYRNSPLCMATRYGHNSVAKLLIENSAFIEVLDKSQGTPLHSAAYNNQTIIAKLLLDAGANADAKNDDNKTPLDIACRYGHIDLVELLEQYASNREKGIKPTKSKVLSQKDFNQLLLHAAQVGNVSKAQELLEYGADIETQDDHKYTPLLLASENGRSEIVKLLIDAGANKEAQMPANYRSNHSKYSSLHFAAKNGHTHTAQILIKAGVNIETQASKDYRALHLACQNGHTEIVELLLNEGADQEARIKDGGYRGYYTPLHFACSYGRYNVVKLLIQKRANIEAQTKGKQLTPLHLAAKRGHMTVAKLLLENGANRDAQDEDQLMPIHYAVISTRLALVKLLIGKGANPNAQISDKRTPLHLAAQEGLVSIVKLLINANAIIDMQDEVQATPLHRAILKDWLKPRIEVVKLLIDHGADLDVECLCSISHLMKKKKRTALQLVQFTKNPEILAYIKKAMKDQKELSRTLFDAIENNNHDLILKHLTSKRFLVNRQHEKDDSTLLHRAVIKAQIPITKLLINMGADLSIKDNEGKTALNCAQDNGYISILSDQIKNKSLIPIKRDLTLDDIGLSTSQKGGSDSKTSAQSHHEDFIINYDDIALDKQIGKGGFGDVYKGTWNGQEVAIKQLHMDKMSDESEQEFTQETKIWFKLRHPNIAQLFGICVPPDPYCMIMAYKKKGSLYKLLKSKESISWDARYRIAKDIVSALLYLHKKNILHRDLKSLNVLVSKQEDQLRASLTDFGLSEIKQETATTTKVGTEQSIGTLLWMAPELLKGSNCSQKSDIYAYGMLLWELASRKRPFKGKPSAVIPTLIKDGNTPEIPTSTPPVFARLIKRCWDLNPKERPSVQDILKELIKASNVSTSSTSLLVASSAVSLGKQSIGDLPSKAVRMNQHPTATRQEEDSDSSDDDMPMTGMLTTRGVSKS